MTLRTASPRLLRVLLNLWPPFLFAGIRVQHLDGHWREARVALRLRRWNRNYVGTQFGGSLFAMTDPFWMLLMMNRIGPGYVVWDRAASIDFLAPGRGDVFARFVLDDELEELLAAPAASPFFRYDGELVLSPPSPRPGLDPAAAAGETPGKDD